MATTVPFGIISPSSICTNVSSYTRQKICCVHPGWKLRQLRLSMLQSKSTASGNEVSAAPSSILLPMCQLLLAATGRARKVCSQPARLLAVIAWLCGAACLRVAAASCPWLLGHSASPRQRLRLSVRQADLQIFMFSSIKSVHFASCKAAAFAH